MMRYLQRPRLDKSRWVRRTTRLGRWCLFGGTIVSCAGLIAMGSYFDEALRLQESGATPTPAQPLGMNVALAVGPVVLLLGAGLSAAGLAGHLLLAVSKFGLRGWFALLAACAAVFYLGSGLVVSLVEYVDDLAQWNAAGLLEFTIPSGQVTISLATIVLAAAQLVLPGLLLALLLIVARDTPPPTTDTLESPATRWLRTARWSALLAGLTLWAEFMMIAAFLALLPYMAESAGLLMFIGAYGFGNLAALAIGVTLAALLLALIPSRGRARPQFSLRTILLATSLCAVLCGTWFTAVAPRISRLAFLDGPGDAYLEIISVEDGAAEAIAMQIAALASPIGPHSLWIAAVGALSVLAVQAKRHWRRVPAATQPIRAPHTGETISNSSMAGSPSQWITAVRP